MYLPGKGSIGFVGTTGWSFSSSGNDFGTFITQTLKTDSTRRLGDFVKVAGKNMSPDSLSFAVRHTVNCYNLLGDPAAKLKLPKYPEFVISDSEFKLTPESVNLNEPVTLKITPKNFGLYADSCLIRFQLKKNNINYLTKRHDLHCVQIP
ncbi:MAG: C25 family cysteine peptidase [Ignavibacteria bacterium]